MGQCLSAAPPTAARSPLADLAGEKQTSAAAPAGVGGGSGETPMMLSAGKGHNEIVLAPPSVRAAGRGRSDPAL